MIKTSKMRSLHLLTTFLISSLFILSFKTPILATSYSENPVESLVPYFLIFSFILLTLSLLFFLTTLILLFIKKKEDRKEKDVKVMKIALIALGISILLFSANLYWVLSILGEFEPPSNAPIFITD